MQSIKPRLLEIKSLILRLKAAYSDLEQENKILKTELIQLKVGRENSEKGNFSLESDPMHSFQSNDAIKVEIKKFIEKIEECKELLK